MKKKELVISIVMFAAGLLIAATAKYFFTGKIVLFVALAGTFMTISATEQLAKLIVLFRNGQGKNPNKK